MRKYCALFFAILLLALSGCGRVRTYEVRFEMNGGTLVSGQLLQTIVEGNAAQEPQVKREGYVFQGWSDSINYITSNKVVTAIWEPVQSEKQETSAETGGNEAPQSTAADTVPATDPFDTYYEELSNRVKAYDSKIRIPSKEATLQESEIYDRYVQGAYGQGIILMDSYKGNKLSLVAEGVRVSVLATQEGCGFVRVEDGQYGWMRLDRLAVSFDAKLSHQRKVDYVIHDSNYWTADGWREWIIQNADDFPDYVVEAALNG